ncbi:MAG: hypothetical protein OXK81_07740, partial [Chloroflexota bacterium]|nr:hypothetical protein [Chloroflexota bacterium]
VIARMTFYRIMIHVVLQVSAGDCAMLLTSGYRKYILALIWSSRRLRQPMQFSQVSHLTGLETLPRARTVRQM